MATTPLPLIKTLQIKSRIGLVFIPSSGTRLVRFPRTPATLSPVPTSSGSVRTPSKLIISLILTFLVTTASYFMNILAMTILLLSHAQNHSSITGPILSLIYFVLFPFLAFFGWHWVLYRACKSEASFLYITYFGGFAMQIGFFVFLGLGLFNGGGG